MPHRDGPESAAGDGPDAAAGDDPDTVAGDGPDTGAGDSFDTGVGGGSDTVDGDGSASGLGPIRATARRIDVAPIVALARSATPRFAWRSPAGGELVGVGATVTIAADGPDRIAAIRDRADAVAERLVYDGPSDARPRFLGGFAFDDEPPTGPWRGFPAAQFVLPRLTVARIDGAGWLTAAVRDGERGPSAAAVADAAVERLGGRETGADETASGEGTPDAVDATGTGPGAAGTGASATGTGPGATGTGPGATGTGADPRGAAGGRDAGDRSLLPDGTPSPAPHAVDGVTETVDRPDRQSWEAGVRAAVDRIEAGELRKVVLAGSLEATLAAPFDLASTLDRLDGAYPDCFRFAVQPADGAAFFGATPERLVERRGATVRTTALAGSAGRDGDPGADRALARDLADSEKRRREHALVLEAVRDQLSPHATEVSVGDRRVRKLQRVQHLETPVAATLGEDAHVLDLVAALHPTPAVGGLPPAAAKRVIAETERFDRGWYAGPVGWFDAAGDGSFAVGIRSAVAEGRRARLFAGSGIVADSDPAAEWAELRLKYHPVLENLG